jgi:hypothetical protein
VETGWLETALFQLGVVKSSAFVLVESVVVAMEVQPVVLELVQEQVPLTLGMRAP